MWSTVTCGVLVVVTVCGLLGSAEETQRSKRTLDLVLRGVADAFGYDILKRPTVIPRATTPQPPQASTFFPPPVAPLTPAPRPSLRPPLALNPPKAVPIYPNVFPVVPAVPLVPRAPRPLLPRIPLPIPRLPPSPKAGSVTPGSAAVAPNPAAAAPAPSVPAKPAAPAAPVAPPAAPPAVSSAPPAASAAPPAAAAAPVLTEVTQKNFTLNFNWNKNVQPVQPSAQPSAAPAKPAAAAKPAAPQAPAAPAAPQAPTAPQPPAATAKPSFPGGQQFLKKPQLFRGYDYEEKGLLQEALSNYYDDPSSLRSRLEKRKEKEKVSEDPKERFKESVGEFWKSFPLTEEHGYKYITPEKQRSPTPNEHSKYEEYDVPEKQRSSPPAEAEGETEHEAEDEAEEEAEDEAEEEVEDKEPDYEEEAYLYLIPRDYYVDYIRQPDHHKSNQAEIGVDYTNDDLHQKPSKKNKYKVDKPVFKSEKLESTYAGAFPNHLHHLIDSESRPRSWSIPYYDYEIESSENKNRYLRKSKNEVEGCCKKSSEPTKFYIHIPDPFESENDTEPKKESISDENVLASIYTNGEEVSKSNEYKNPT